MGDEINTLAMAIGYNMRKILRHIVLWLQILKAIFRLHLTNQTPKHVL
jgi:hypothetical protein